jgi:hypothetical protein
MKDSEEMIVMLRPKTGMGVQYKFYCIFSNNGFTLSEKRETLIWAKAKYDIPYSAIEKIENSDYGRVVGVRIYLNDPKVAFPSSPSLVVGGLIGGIVQCCKKDKFILYFAKSEYKQIFLEHCFKNNVCCMQKK